MKRLLTTSLFCLTGCSLFAHTGASHEKLVPATESLDHKSIFEMSIVGEKRVFKSNGIPNHTVAPFPNRGNPHEVSEQNYQLTAPLNPKVAKEPIPMSRQPFGIALNGVLFDPGTAEYYQNDRNSVWNYDALGGARPLGLDENHAHVQPNGAYHYHGIPSALVKELSKDSEDMTLVGWAADGFPIYAVHGYTDADDNKSGLTKLTSSYRVKEGNRPKGDDSPGGKYDGSFTLDYEYVEGSGDLDECGGRHGVTPEFPKGTYYYVLTDDYPFVPRMFKGTPDPSFNKRGGRNGRARGEHRGSGANGHRVPPPPPHF
ncbi:MAG: YHYH protein [Opitutaceae bacterium]